MHPEQIKAELRMQGVTLVMLAEQLGVSRSMVSHVINGHAKSAAIQQRIANLLGRTVESLWEQRPSLRRNRVGVPPATRTATAA